MRKPRTVSYTHLDVYKRQSLHNAQASGFVIRCRREMYGGYDRYLLEKQL